MIFQHSQHDNHTVTMGVVAVKDALTCTVARGKCKSAEYENPLQKGVVKLFLVSFPDLFPLVQPLALAKLGLRIRLCPWWSDKHHEIPLCAEPAHISAYIFHSQSSCSTVGIEMFLTIVFYVIFRWVS